MAQPKKIENIFLWGARILIFLIPLLPLYISNSMVFQYVTGKNFAFRILVETAAVLWIILAILNKQYRPNNSAMVQSVLTFTFVIGLADLLGVNPYNSFWSNYERMEGYITILHLALYFMIIRSILQTRKNWMIFFNISLLGSFFVSLYALIAPIAPSGTAFLVEYGKRVYGTVGNPPFLAAYLLLAIFISILVLHNTQRRYLKILYVFLIVLHTIVIYLTATRGAILSGFAGAAIMSAFYFFSEVQDRKWKINNTAIVIAVVTCFAAVAVVIAISDRNHFLKQDVTISRFATILSSNSVKARLHTWEMAWNGFRERPLLGWGQENFIGVYTVNQIPFRGEQVWADRAHNIVIEWLINAGILGLLSYMAIYATSLYVIRKKRLGKLLSKKEAVTIATALFVYFIQNLFTFDTINTYFLFFAVMAYIDVVGTVPEKEDSEHEDEMAEKRTGVKSIGLIFITITIFSAIYFFANYRPMNEAKRSFRISTSVSDYKSFSALLGDFKGILTLDTFGNYDVRERMEFVSNYILSRELFSVEGALKFLKETAVELEKGITENYHNLEYITRVIELYGNIAFYEPEFISRTELLIRWCMNINSRYEWLYYALADTYKLKQEYTKMFEIVNNMASLDPDNDQKQLKLALAAISMKKDNTVAHALEEIKRIRGTRNTHIASGKVPVFEMNELFLIAKAYREAKDFRQEINYLNEVVARDPTYPWVYYGLAIAHLNLGDEAYAIKAVKKAAELDASTYGKIAEDLIGSLTN